MNGKNKVTIQEIKNPLPPRQAKVKPSCFNYRMQKNYVRPEIMKVIVHRRERGERREKQCKLACNRL